MIIGGSDPCPNLSNESTSSFCKLLLLEIAKLFLCGTLASLVVHQSLDAVMFQLTELQACPLSKHKYSNHRTLLSDPVAKRHKALAC